MTLVIIVILVSVLAIGALVIYEGKQYRYVSSYTDINGKVYKCSKTIKTKIYNAGKADLEYFVPVNPNDANLYCHQIGIS
jgi:hypothetical protein